MVDEDNIISNYLTNVKFNFTKHMISKHKEKENLYKCEHCDYSTVNPTNLQNHYRSKHGGEKLNKVLSQERGKIRKTLKIHQTI